MRAARGVVLFDKARVQPRGAAWHSARVPSVISLSASELKPSALVLASAFRDNPGFVAMFPRADGRRREQMLVPCMEGFVASMLRYGMVHAVRDQQRIVAVALSFRPHQFPPPPLATLMQAKGPLRAGIRTVLRFAKTDMQLRRHHPRYPHFYLWFLGVEPDQQGRGFGSLLLRSLSELADAEQMPCCLETDTQRNVKLYERHGYVLDAEATIPALDVPFWFMSRPPRAAAGMSAQARPGSSR